MVPVQVLDRANEDHAVELSSRQAVEQGAQELGVTLSQPAKPESVEENRALTSEHWDRRVLGEHGVLVADVVQQRVG